MTQPKHYLYSCTIQINTRGRVPVERKRYAYVTLDGFIKLACNAQDVPAYTADTLEYAILEEYRNGFNAMGLERRVSLRKFRDSQYDLNKAVNGCLGHLAMIKSQLDRLEFLDQNHGLDLFINLHHSVSPKTLSAIVDTLTAAVRTKQSELGFRAAIKEVEPYGLG